VEAEQPVVRSGWMLAAVAVLLPTSPTLPIAACSTCSTL
jgi:hypothetical protein